MAFATEETWRWQITDSPTWKRWHPGTDTKCTSTTTGSNVWKDLQKKQWLCFVGMLQTRSGTSDLEELRISLGKNHLVKFKKH